MPLRFGRNPGPDRRILTLHIPNLKRPGLMMRPGRLTFTHDRYLSFRHSDSPDYLTAFAVDTPQDTVIIQHNPLTIERNRNRSDPFQCHTLGRDSQQVTFAGIVSRTVKHIPNLHRAGETIRPDFRYECGRKHPSPAFTPMLVIFDQLRPAHITTGLLRPILIMGEKRYHPLGAGSTQVQEPRSIPKPTEPTCRRVRTSKISTELLIGRNG